MAFKDTIAFLYDMGFFDVVLPFIFIFAIVFAILEKSKIFNVDGEPRRNINLMIAFVLGFIFIVSETAVNYFQEFLPKIALALLGLVCFFLILGMSGHSLKFNTNWVMFSMLLLLVIIAVGNYIKLRFFEIISEFVFQPFVITLLAFFLVIFYLTKDSEGGIKVKKNKPSISNKESAGKPKSGPSSKVGNIKRRITKKELDSAKNNEVLWKE